MKAEYTKAALELLNTEKSVEQVLSGLKSTLVKNNHQSLLPSILRGLLKQLESSRGFKGAVVIVADLDAAKSSIVAALNELGATGKPEIIVDENIIGGVIATYDNQVLDNSYKSKLVSLYRNTQR